MNFELFIAKRIHFSKSGDRKVTPPIVRISMIGIALGLAVMILSIAIVIGFKKEIRNKVIGFGSHIQITNFGNNNSYDATHSAISDTLMAEVQHYPGSKHVVSFATKPGILKTDADFQGIVLKGVDANYDWSFFKSHLIAGDTLAFSPDKYSTDAIISKTWADLIGLMLHDAFLTYFVTDDVRARIFLVSGIYEIGVIDYAKLFVLSDIRQLGRRDVWDED